MLVHMQLSLAFMSYTTFVVYDHRRFSGGPKRPIAALSTSSAEHYTAVSSSSITTHTEPKEVLGRAGDIGVADIVTASQPEAVPDTKAAGENSVSRVAQVPSVEADSSTYKIDSTSAFDASTQGHTSDGSRAVPSHDCVGEMPIAKPRQYPIKYPLSTDDYPLAEGVYSNCKVRC